MYTYTFACRLHVPKTLIRTQLDREIALVAFDYLSLSFPLHDDFVICGCGAYDYYCALCGGLSNLCDRFRARARLRCEMRSEFPRETCAHMNAMQLVCTQLGPRLQAQARLQHTHVVRLVRPTAELLLYRLL